MQHWSNWELSVTMFEFQTKFEIQTLLLMKLYQLAMHMLDSRYYVWNSNNTRYATYLNKMTLTTN